MHVNYSKLELNLIGPQSNIPVIVDYIKKNRIKYVVTTQDNIAALIVNRSTKKAVFKIILAVDFPNGKQFGLMKFTNLMNDVQSVDGFEVTLSEGTRQANKNEIELIHNMIKGQMNRLTELRWVLDLNSMDKWGDHLEFMKKYPVDLIRVGKRFDTPYTEETLEKAVKTIKKYVPYKMKASVKLETPEVLEFGLVERFDILWPEVKELGKEDLIAILPEEAPVE